MKPHNQNEKRFFPKEFQKAFHDDYDSFSSITELLLQYHNDYLDQLWDGITSEEDADWHFPIRTLNSVLKHYQIPVLDNLLKEIKTKCEENNFRAAKERFAQLEAAVQDLIEKLRGGNPRVIAA